MATVGTLIILDLGRSGRLRELQSQLARVTAWH